MSEEEREKEAIWYFSKVLSQLGLEDVKKYWKVIENLIEKQQKEIQSLKEKHKELNAITTSCLDTLKKCVHKDTIREILYSNNDDLTIILKIKELLEEN